MVIRGVTVIRAGEITWPAPPIQVSAQPQAAQKAAPEVKTEEKCACSPWRKYALMALAIILFGWMASVAPKSSLDTSLCSRWPALSVITWCGMYRTRCIHR